MGPSWPAPRGRRLRPPSHGRQLAFLAAFLAAVLAAVFFAAVLAAGLAASVVDSPRDALALSTDFLRAASRSTTSPDSSLDSGANCTSPPSTLALTSDCSAAA